jgi:4-methyl-5(b-hydroxyethyl)-thiazole monophosphate biosynthesis
MASILIPLAQGCEELEAVTLIDLFRRAQFHVTTASLDAEVITAARGTKLIADTSLAELNDQLFDMVVLPGGLPGANHLRDDAQVQSVLKQHHAAGRHLAAICAAPRALVAAGVMEGVCATSYPGTLDQMDVPGMRYLDDDVVIDGKIITSRGPGTAIDFALSIIEILAGKEKRIAVETPLLRPTTN